MRRCGRGEREKRRGEEEKRRSHSALFKTRTQLQEGWER